MHIQNPVYLERYMESKNNKILTSVFSCLKWKTYDSVQKKCIRYEEWYILSIVICDDSTQLGFPVY